MGVEQTPQSATSRAPRGILKVHRAANPDSRSQRSAPSPGYSQGNSFSYPGRTKPPVALEPTYKTQPDETKKFCSERGERILKEILESHLGRSKYSAEHCSRLTHNLCSVIKTRMKAEGYERYRLVAQVLIGQDTEQGLQLASRCLWNPQTDNFAAATYRNSSIYAIALVYGLYLD
jgi:hypothetical protein